MHGPTVYVGSYREMCAMARRLRSGGPYLVRKEALT